jgi:hypothetical protein
MKTLNQKLKELSPARQKKIEARLAHLVAEDVFTRSTPCQQLTNQERIAPKQSRRTAKRWHRIIGKSTFIFWRSASLHSASFAAIWKLSN